MEARSARVKGPGDEASLMHAPISFSPPQSGGTYFACIAYVEGVAFQLKLRDVQFRATFFCVLCGVDSAQVGNVRGKKQ